MLAELAPAGAMEEMLAQRIVDLSWRLRRAERLQAAAYDKIETKSERPEPTMSPEDAGKLLAFLVKENMRCPAPVSPPPGRRAVQDFNQERVLDRLLVYERRIEHSLYRTMAELRKERSLRETNPLADGGLPRSTGILPVSSMGVPPMTVEDIHGQDARATHGRDAHATEPPDGGTPNESRQTNPICSSVSSLTREVANEQGQTVCPPAFNLTLSTAEEPPEGVTPNAGGDKLCEAKPISAAAKTDRDSYVPIFRRRR